MKNGRFFTVKSAPFSTPCRRRNEVMKQDMKFIKSEKRYETEEIAAILGYWKLRLAPLGEWDEWQKLSDDRFVDAVVARLRAADKLCAAVSSLSEGYWGFANLHFVAGLEKAIAGYEGKEEK
jgi:hypothetical protein